MVFAGRATRIGVDFRRRRAPALARRFQQREALVRHADRDDDAPRGERLAAAAAARRRAASDDDGRAVERRHAAPEGRARRDVASVDDALRLEVDADSSHDALRRRLDLQLEDELACERRSRARPARVAPRLDRGVWTGARRPVSRRRPPRAAAPPRPDEACRAGAAPGSASMDATPASPGNFQVLAASSPGRIFTCIVFFCRCSLLVLPATSRSNVT